MTVRAVSGRRIYIGRVVRRPAFGVVVFFSSRRRHTRSYGDWSSDVCSSDLQGAGWNIIQSLIAVGSGGATGKGLTAGTQSPLGYLPIAESDFVFAGLAEDLGFAGAIILFALYIVLLFAALRVAFRARDPFGMLIGGGIATMLVFQILVNVGVAISLMPVTGIPLPFISHGGSSLVSICFALGVP